MGIFDFLKSKKKIDVEIEQKSFTLDNIKLLIDLTVCNEDASKLKFFLDDRLGKQVSDNQTFNESIEFNSQEIVDFIAAKSIYFYGYLDWKEHSKEFDFYVRNALKRNFQLELTNMEKSDLGKLTTIREVYKLYGAELEKLNVTLCNIDVGDDSYQVMLVRSQDYSKLFEPVNKLGFRVEHYTEDW